MEKFRYGTKEIIATLIGVALLVGARWLEIFLVQNGIITGEIFEWFRIRVLIVALIAIFYGPICGALCGIGGNLLLAVIYDTSISYPLVFILGIYGFILGLYFGKTHYDGRTFTPRVFADFNAIQVLASIICALFLVPLFQFLVEGVNVYDAVTAGAKRTVGNSILVGVVCSIVMLIRSIAKRPKTADRGLEEARRI